MPWPRADLMGETYFPLFPSYKIRSPSRDQQVVTPATQQAKRMTTMPRTQSR